MKKIRGIAVLMLIPLAAFLAVRMLAPPKVVPAGAPASEFSAERAFQLLETIAAEPHPLGTPAHDVVRDRILRMWRDLGFEPEVQKALYLEAEDHYAARVENILARLPGTNPVPGGAVCLATHYDSVEPAPGAADDGSGVVTLLETARALKNGPPPARDVIFLITDGEEDGLLGADVFQKEHPWAKNVGLVLNFEARGTAGPSLMFQTSEGNERIIEALAAVPHPRAYSFAAAVYRSMPNDTDLSIWLEAGLPGLNFAFIGRPYDYHTAGDNLARLDRRSLQHHGSYALALARKFGNEGIPPRTAGNAVHFSLFGDLLVRYSGTTAKFLLAVIAGLLAAAAGVGFKRKTLRWGGILRGVLFMASSMLLSGGLGFGFLALVRAVHGSLLPEAPWRHSPVYLLAVIFLAAAATTFLHGVFRAGKRGFEIAFGASVLWFGLAVAVTLLAVDASYLGAGPALFLALGVLAWAARRKPAGDDCPAPPFWAAALTAAGVIFIAAPMTLLLFESMFLSPLIAALLAAFVSISLAAMTPAVEVARRDLGRGLPVICAAMFMILAAVAAFSVRYTGEIPRLVSLQYLRDFDAEKAYWVARTKVPDAWTERISGGEFKNGHPRPELVNQPEAYSHREAPVMNAAPPEVGVTEEGNSGSIRRLRFRVVSPRGGRRILVTAEGAKIVSAALEGRPLVLRPDKEREFGLLFINPGPAGFEMSLETEGAAPVPGDRSRIKSGIPGPSGIHPAAGTARNPAPPHRNHDDPDVHLPLARDAGVREGDLHDHRPQSPEDFSEPPDAGRRRRPAPPRLRLRPGGLVRPVPDVR